MCKSLDYYLSKGYDLPAAQYFSNGRRKITGIQANDDFTLSLSFDNGETRIYDMNENLTGEVFKPFRDLHNFRRVYIDEFGCVAWDVDPSIDSSVVWNNKVDLCPDSCYIDSKPIVGGNTDA